MNNRTFLPDDTKKIVFAWDCSTRFVAAAETFVENLGPVFVHSLHAMPHESIYYGSCNQSRDEMSSFERRLHREYRKAVNSTQTLRKYSKFEVLFGDRMFEILRFAQVMKASFILTPCFEQSNFSRWLHGDLNKKIVRKASCPVVFLDNKVGTTPHSVSTDSRSQ